MKERIKRLNALQDKLEGFTTIDEKLDILNQTDEVKEFFKALSPDIFDQLGSLKNFLLKCLLCIDQKNLVSLWLQGTIAEDQFKILETIDHFYGPNGIIAYQLTILTLMLESESNSIGHHEGVNYLKPVGIDLSDDSKEVRALVRLSIEHLDQIAEIYPVGGAGDRLNLCDRATHLPLSVAFLPFLGKTLLEGLIRDVQAREFLYFKLTGKQLITPIAMMTSQEKSNESQILQLCNEKNWFDRPKTKFFIFSQPMVPVVTIDGDWLLISTRELMLKPGGHGVIWKLAFEKGVLDWFEKENASQLLCRQINNPIAGVDFGVLGFMGAGLRDHKAFGFASCERFLNTSEGMDILIETKMNNGFEYKISNIEYTEFMKKGIEDTPEQENSLFSKFPANTNLLFLDLKIFKKLNLNKIPGMLVNMKTTVPYVDNQGSLKETQATRLESTMQNIADEIVDFFPMQLKEYSQLKSYITYNQRNKTISVTKKSFKEGNFQETPESCFFDLYKNYYDLFSNYCNVRLPSLDDIPTYLKQGPSVLIYYHPALGPHYSIIAQKIQGGSFSSNAELQLEIAELNIENLELAGSLLIHADNAMGSMNEENRFEYGKNLGSCCLKNVKVNNLGIDREAKNCFWKNEINRLESLTITLHGNAELIAENVTFTGTFHLEVMDQEILRITQKEGELIFQREKREIIKTDQSYQFDEEDRIIIK